MTPLDVYTRIVDVIWLGNGQLFPYHSGILYSLKSYDDPGTVKSTSNIKSKCIIALKSPVR